MFYEINDDLINLNQVLHIEIKSLLQDDLKSTYSIYFKFNQDGIAYYFKLKEECEKIFNDIKFKIKGG
jgi:hypothetical protein